MVRAYPGRAGVSTRGELGVARAFSTDALEHRLQLVGRGRAQDRRYGGSIQRSLGAAPFGEADNVARPDLAFPVQSHDRVPQRSIGMDYQLRATGAGQCSIGLQKVNSRKKVTHPSEAAPKYTINPLHLHD